MVEERTRSMTRDAREGVRKAYRMGRSSDVGSKIVFYSDHMDWCINVIGEEQLLVKNDHDDQKTVSVEEKSPAEVIEHINRWLKE